MIDKKKILDCLEKESLEEIDQIEYNDSIAVYNFIYGFDTEEIEAARDYADQNYDQSEGEDNWNEEFFLPYLTEIAADNITDILDDISTTFDLDGEFMVYELDRSAYEKCEFTIVLAEKGVKFDIEEIMDKLEL